MDESRKQFEDWAIKKADEYGYNYKGIILKRFGEGYVTSWVDMAWVGWQASREAINEK